MLTLNRRVRLLSTTTLLALVAVTTASHLPARAGGRATAPTAATVGHAALRHPTPTPRATAVHPARHPAQHRSTVPRRPTHPSPRPARPARHDSVPRRPAARAVTAAQHPRPGCDVRPGWQQRRGQQAVRHLAYPVGDLGFTVRFLPARKGYTGMTYSLEHRIDLYVRTCSRESDQALLVTLAHEVGHAIDVSHLSDRRHSDWLAARGSRSPWFGCNGCSDYATGAGDFAEVFAWSRTHDRAQYRSTVAAPPTDSQLRQLSKMFDPTY